MRERIFWRLAQLMSLEGERVTVGFSRERDSLVDRVGDVTVSVGDSVQLSIVVALALKIGEGYGKWRERRGYCTLKYWTCFVHPVENGAEWKRAESEFP